MTDQSHRKSEFVFVKTHIETFLSMDPEEGQELVSNLIQAFQRNVPVAISEMRAGLEKSDFDKVSFQAHKVKSTCGNLGLTSMSEIAKEMEDLSKSSSRSQWTEKLIELLTDFESQYSMAKAQLQPYLQGKAA